MSEEDITVIAAAETPRNYIKLAKADESKHRKNKYTKRATKGEDEKQKKTILRRLPSFDSTLTFSRIRERFRKLSCVKSGEEEDEVPMMEIPRHKSIDIGVGLARRMSLFLFTKRTVCVHPYHPYTPEQTTRKIYVFTEDK